VVRLWDGQDYSLAQLRDFAPLLTVCDSPRSSLSWRPSFDVPTAIYASLQRNAILLGMYWAVSSRPVGELCWVFLAMTGILFAYYACKARLGEPKVSVANGCLSWTHWPNARWNDHFIPMNIWLPLEAVRWRVVYTFVDEQRVVRLQPQRAIRLHARVAHRWYSPFGVWFTFVPSKEDFELWVAFLSLIAEGADKRDRSNY
jgi:hypothetical protein